MKGIVCIQKIINIKILAIKTNSECEIRDMQCYKNEENTNLKLLPFNQINSLFEVK